MKMTPATPDPQKIFWGPSEVSIFEFETSSIIIMEMARKKPLEPLQ